MVGFHSGCSSQNRDSSAPKEDRKPAAAGRFYPGSAQEIRTMLDTFFSAAQTKDLKNVLAVISPHAGYVFSGKVAACAFRQIDPGKKYDNVFLIASSHQVSFMGASIYNKGDYVTPLGKVPVNIDLANRLIKENPVFTFYPEADKYEHSAEVQVPFLQYYLKKPFQLVPVVLGTQSAESCKKIADALRPWFNEKNLFIISTDFSHYPAYDAAIAADKATCDVIAGNDPDAFLKFLEDYKHKRIPNLATNCCGWTSVLTLLYLTSGDPSCIYTPVFYQNSGDEVYGDKSQVVGYWAIAVSRSPDKSGATPAYSLSAREKSLLLGIARKTLQSYIRKGTLPAIDTAGFTENMKIHAGAFVTLKEDGQLRGCIGRFTSDVPLYEVIQEMTVSSSTQDYRFSPVQPQETDKIEIEISVLSPMKKIRTVDEIELGKHGIYIKKGYASGTFLPQVATETGWTKEEFLGHCARDKAGIGWDGWKNADIFTYEAFVFSESDFSGRKE